MIVAALSIIVALQAFLIGYPLFQRWRRSKVSTLTAVTADFVTDRVKCAAREMVNSRRVTMSFSDDESQYALLSRTKNYVLGRRSHDSYAYFNFPICFLLIGLVDIYSKSGDQGNSWYNASVSLNSYLGTSVQLRYVGTTGSSYRGDMTIDDIKVTNGVAPVGTDLSLTITFDNYPEETSWTLKNSAGSTVASGGTYASQADGTTATSRVLMP